MSILDRHFDEQDLQRISATLDEAEANTAAEIVCVAAASSGRYDRAEDIFGLLLGLIAAAAVWLFVPDAVPGGDAWVGYQPATKIGFMAAAVVAGFIVGAVLASHVWTLRRPFIPKRQQRDCVLAAASAAFFDQSIHRVRAGAGMLIYLSMDERRAVLLADGAVLGTLTQPTLDTLCRDLTDLLADTDPTEALCQTLRRVGEYLAELPPDESGHTDESPNRLVLIS